MSTYPVITTVDGIPAFSKPLNEILAELKEGGALEILTPAEYITEQQRKFWKGVLLPALAKDSGDTVTEWESRLKLAVLPDDFQPVTVNVDGIDMVFIPSVTKLSKKKMNILIEGSVAQCHKWGIMWVTLPDKELRKNIVYSSPKQAG